MEGAERFKAVRAEAKRAGDKYYFTGKPCINGHIAQRNTTDGGCLVCKAQRGATKTALAKKRKYYQDNKHHIHTRQAIFRKNNVEKKRAQDKRYYEDNKLALTLKRNGIIDTPDRLSPELCECCGGENKAGRGMCMDHDHHTGLFRGWICDLCNTGIGKLGDSIEGLEAAIVYLKKHYEGK